MDKRILLTLALGAMSQVFAHAWEPKGDKIKTVWAEQVTPENVWQSYPRPQLQRAE
jgi:predicted phosphohydrolase